MKTGIKKNKEVIYIHFGSDAIERDISVKNHLILDFNKPLNGLWACKYTPNKEYRSDWERWCCLNQFKGCDLSKHFLFTLKESARVLKISSFAEYNNIGNKFKNKDNFIDW